MKISGWGLVGTAQSKLISAADATTLANALTSGNRELSSAIPRGAGRSYGDQALAESVISSRRFNHFLGFDSTSGVLQVEAGVSLGEIQRLFMPRGWALPVTPGTQFVTVGGAIANDVHGKNHHTFGTFGEHIQSLTLVRSTGEILHCSNSENRDLFRATIGGLGLTGFIASAEIRLKPVTSNLIDAEALTFHSLEEFWQQTADSESFEYTVSWIDIRKNGVRGIFNRGHDHHTHEIREQRRLNLTVPFTPPIGFINRLTVGALAQAYYAMGSKSAGSRTIHYEPFFYPLDSIKHWNRAYGRKGFFQHQALLPKSNADQGLKDLVEAVRSSGEKSAVSVLKTTGQRNSPGMLSYPIEGVTLALDFANRGDSTRKLLERLDAITVEHGGRVNPSKDATMSSETFYKSFGTDTVNAFLEHRDPGFQSQQSIRLLGK